MKVITPGDDQARGYVWCKLHGLDPNRVSRIELHWFWAKVTVFKLNAVGRPYLDPESGGRRFASETKRRWR